MNYGFNHEQLDADLNAVKGFFIKFVKSFGKSPKKVNDKEVGLFEEYYIRFRLHLVDMGISKVIRSVIVIIVGIIVYFTLFRHADTLFKIIIGFGFLSYYIWLFMPHLVVDGKFEWKDGKVEKYKADGWLAGHFIDFHNTRVDHQTSFKKSVTDFFDSLFGKKSETKK